MIKSEPVNEEDETVKKKKKAKKSKSEPKEEPAEADVKLEPVDDEAEVAQADAYWLQKAEETDWDCICPAMSVYRYCGKVFEGGPA